MRWFMPCKLGETYPETKFIDWINEARVFGLTGRHLQLREVDVGMRIDFAEDPEVFRTYSAYTERGELHLESYSVGKWNFERFILEIPDSEFEEQVRGKKKVRLLGVKYSEEGLLGHYITCDRYEHFYEPINIEMVYTEYVDRQYIHFEFEGGLQLMTENNNAIKVEVVPCVEAEITDIDKASVAASEESLKAEIEAVPNHTEEEIADEVGAAIKENNKPFQIRAKEKLEEELKKAKDKSFAEPIIEYLLKRCAEDVGLAEDVCQAHKTLNKCFNFIYESARKVAKGNHQCAVRDDVVCEWAEDYYHKDDKAEEEKKAKEKCEREKKQKEDQKKRIEGMEKRKTSKNNATTTTPTADTNKAYEPKPQSEAPKEKSKKNEMDGQMDLFSMMGL